ncbi:hypothetical protein B0H21DRAFT_705974 [Amylocystis lapponica]|nr:hypothetical protein B0H21DRAFT_705974 [Amylocystis lapponica]
MVHDHTRMLHFRLLYAPPPLIQSHLQEQQMLSSGGSEDSDRRQGPHARGTHGGDAASAGVCGHRGISANTRCAWDRRAGACVRECPRVARRRRAAGEIHQGRCVPSHDVLRAATLVAAGTRAESTRPILDDDEYEYTDGFPGTLRSIKRWFSRLMNGNEGSDILDLVPNMLGRCGSSAGIRWCGRSSLDPTWTDTAAGCRDVLRANIEGKLRRRGLSLRAPRAAGGMTMDRKELPELRGRRAQASGRAYVVLGSWRGLGSGACGAWRVLRDGRGAAAAVSGDAARATEDMDMYACAHAGRSGRWPQSACTAGGRGKGRCQGL